MDDLESVETLDEVPRDLVYAMRVRRTRYTFSPAADALSAMALIDPDQLAEEAEAARNIHLERKAKGNSIRWPWNPRLLKKKRGLARGLRKRVKVKEGSYTLWDARPEELVHKVELRGSVLTGEVSSLSGDGVYHPKVNNVFYSPYSDPDPVNAFCECAQFGWSGITGGQYQTQNFCKHLFLLLNWFWTDQFDSNSRRIKIRRKGDQPNLGLFSPFAFSRNRHYDAEGKFVPYDQLLASLVWDWFLARYGSRKSYYAINDKGMDVSWYMTPQLEKGIDDGVFTREVLTSGKRKRRMSRDQARDEERLWREFRRVLRRYGYKRLEAKQREFESVAWHYEREGNTVNVVFSDKVPPFYVVRGAARGEANPKRKSPDLDPYRLLGQRNIVLYDDRLMRETAGTSVHLLTAPRLPETGMRYLESNETHATRALRTRYRHAMRAAGNGNVPALKFQRVRY